MQHWISFLTTQLTASPWVLAAAALTLLGVAVLLASVWALLRLRPLSFLLRLAAGGLLFALGALAATVAVGTSGYLALTRETSAASVQVQPIGPQHYSAIVRFPDGRSQSFDLAGDEIYVDARILKWKPVANMLGLHTAYELDRIAGRYHSLADERAAPRTVYALGLDRPVDMFSLRRRYVMLEPLLDAEYGSASFVPVTRPAEFDVRVSTTGVLIRERAP